MGGGVLNRLRMGAGCQGNQPWDYRVGIFSFIPKPLGTGKGLEAELQPVANEIVNHE